MNADSNLSFTERDLHLGARGLTRRQNLLPLKEGLAPLLAPLLVPLLFPLFDLLLNPRFVLVSRASE